MLPNYIYKQGLRYFDAGYAAAMAIVFVLVMTPVHAVLPALAQERGGKAVKQRRKAHNYASVDRSSAISPAAR